MTTVHEPRPVPLTTPLSPFPTQEANPQRTTPSLLTERDASLEERNSPLQGLDTSAHSAAAAADDALLPPLVHRLVAQATAIAQLLLAMLALIGSGVFAATLLDGRSALFWPSRWWLAIAVTVWSLGGALWWAAARAVGPAPPQSLLSSSWPTLALLPVAAAAAGMYLDDRSNHFLSTYAPTRESLLAYALALYVGAQGAFWLRLAHGRWLARDNKRAPAGVWPALAWLIVALAAAAYLSASVFGQWLPTQNDLRVNLIGARELLSGQLPYHDTMPVWGDRVHMLPVTLWLLFGPLTALPEDVTRVLFFLGNQALWLAAMWLLVLWLVPQPRHWLWLAGALLLGATFWPWQESIRFGQQDGLLLLLFAATITGAQSSGRRSLLSGAALGLVFIVKPLSIWLPLMYVLHRRWRALFVAGATVAALVLVSLPFTGVTPWLHFATVEVPDMLSGTVRGTNIPLPSLHARFFVGREQLLNGDPAPNYLAITAMNTAANVLGLLLVAQLAIRPAGDRHRAWLLDASIGLALTLLLAPMAWQHYASWLLIALFVLTLPEIWQPLSPAARLAGASLAGTGFILLSLNDERLLKVVEPLVERWPGVLAFYTLGLVALLSSLLVARFGTLRPLPQRGMVGGRDPARQEADGQTLRPLHQRGRVGEGETFL